MSRAKPTWGRPRIHGEQLKLGMNIVETSVSKYMVRHRKPPSQTWRTFLETTNGVESLRAALPQVKVRFDGAALSRTPRAGAAKPTDSSPQAIATWVRLVDGRLTSVNLASASLSDAQLAFLENLPDVQKRELQVTQVSDLGPSSIQQLTSLRELNLSNTTVSSAGLSKLAALSRLETLTLAGTLVDGPGLAQLKGLPALRYLDLSGSHVANRGLADIALLTGLRTLQLRFLDITDSGLGGIAKLAKLESLDLSSTEITDAGLKQIAALTNVLQLPRPPSLNRCRGEACSAPLLREHLGESLLSQGRRAALSW